MIDDEFMIISDITRGNEVNAGSGYPTYDFITVVRGCCGTNTQNYGWPTAMKGSSHSDRGRIKNAKRYAATGEELTNRLDLITGSGALNSLSLRRNLGSTFKEFLINYDVVAGINGPYINTWLPTVIEEDSIYDVGTDFGFGAYNAEDDDGGYLNKNIMREGRYNEFKLFNVMQASDVIANEDLDLLLRYRDDTIPHVTNLNTRFSETNVPFIYAVYEDVLPEHPILSVKPYEEDAFCPEFIWEAGDDDLWYGMLNVDSKNIDNQYVSKVAHIPLNEDTSAYSSLYLENQLFTKIAATAGTFTSSKEGLAGFTKVFDGIDDYIKFGDYTAPTEEMTIVAHIIPDAIPSSKGYVLYKSLANNTYSDYEIYLDSNSRINAKVTATGGTTTPIALQSSSIVVDGLTPTAIALTVDKNLKSGNVKLFINGRLDDQSGLVKSTATVNNWLNNANILDSSSDLYIGTSFISAAQGNFFSGKMEEFVIYNRCLYPVVPQDGSFVFTKPLEEISNSSSKSYTARLFVKDYHNIRGGSSKEVATSSSVSFRKASFRLEA